MSSSKQQRRAEKKRRAAQARRTQRAEPSRADAGGTIDDAALERRLITAAANDMGATAYRDALDTFIRHLAGADPDTAAMRRITLMLDRLIQRNLGAMFEAGWQPADVAHLVRRNTTQRTQRLATAHIALHARTAGAVDRAPRQWLGQLDDLGVYDPARAVLMGVKDEPFSAWSRAERLHVEDAIAGALQLLGQTLRASRLNRLIDPPSAWGATNKGTFTTPTVSAGDVDAKALKLIRNLLAKAEATTFEAEAATFNAKAQELMTRHSIDAAVIASAARGSGHDFGVESRRVHIDNPYADEKAVLLAVIADVNGVRSVWMPRVGFSTVVGIPVDLHLTDLLFTSLLVQATKASAEATGLDRRLSTPSFRRAFLTAFADRIGERLKAAKTKVGQEATAEYGAALVHILADREAAVDTAFAEAFPDTVPMANRRLDARGYNAGRAAADRAHIGAGEAITSG